MITLASASPRRQQLLTQIGVSYVVKPVDIVETPQSTECASDYVQRLALTKAEHSWHACSQYPVLGADTCIALDQKILGKPQDREHGLAMLHALSGRKHQVFTAIAMVDGCQAEIRLNQNDVWFAKLSQAQITAYWASGEPLDKAGGYAIQGEAARFITRLEGSYSGVMGLPLYETAELLGAFAIKL